MKETMDNRKFLLYLILAVVIFFSGFLLGCYSADRIREEAKMEVTKSGNSLPAAEIEVMTKWTHISSSDVQYRIVMVNGKRFIEYRDKYSYQHHGMESWH